ncbi:MAG: hypothetical protein FWG90_05935 [Oscillospiraceae bacterium]|nr:hypothetical protein [Oscillospiraceae bacterium]
MYQTMEEIEKKYDGNFVCMINCKKSQYHSVIGGEVIAASAEKEPVLDVWANCDYDEPYYRYIGSFQEMAGGFLL